MSTSLRDKLTKPAADQLYPLAANIETGELLDNLADLMSDGESEDREESTTYARDALLELVDQVAELVREAKKSGLIDFELIDSRSTRAKEEIP
jgi:hypothetical protein